jgi:hypothetical protein
MKKLLPAALIVLLLTNAKCKLTGPDEIECNNNTLQLSSKAKSYFYFKQGSWWVYYNLTTNVYDSLFVVSSQNKIRQPAGDGEDRSKCYEISRTTILSKRGEYSFGSSLDVSASKRTTLFEENGSSQNNGSNMELFFWEDSVELINKVRPYEIKLIDSLNIQNKWYKNLIEVKSEKVGFDNFDYRLYAKNIGLIKFINKQSNNWELIKHEIHQ